MADHDTTEDIEVVPEVEGEEEEEQAVREPGKLLRIALMLRGMQEEVRRASPDGAGRDRLRVVHERALVEMREVLSGDLRDELNELTLPFEDGTPTESEILIAQAQLIGWLEGLFQGIQAAIYQQHLQAREQLDQMRQRGLPPGAIPGMQQAEAEGPSTGHYL
jgi:hypothetical protein